MLTDNACRQAKPGPKNRKLSDSGGLYLMVLTSGTKSWRWKYSFRGKEKTLSIGLYPEVSLRDARSARDEARRLLLTGGDPSAEKRRQTSNRTQMPSDSFEALAEAWHRSQSAGWKPRYAAEILRRLENNVFPEIGSARVNEITAPMVLEVIRKIEQRGVLEMAHRVRMHMSDVFVWAIASGLATSDPAGTIRKALEPRTGKLRPAMITIAGARSVLVETEKLKRATSTVLLASRLLALTAARPGVVRMAEKHEFEDLDGDSPIWRIPAVKMKLTRERRIDASFEFILPLSHQAVATVRTALAIAPQTQWLFAGIGDRRQPITDSTISRLYRLAGFTGRHVPHGWRSSFSTIMNERAAREDRERDRAIIDLMLAHVQEGVEAAYNRAAYMPRRREIAQAWADMLMEGVSPPGSLIA
ncbi:tyrosine-type recombinase/integrase [Blastomonas sp.]|uniref:tyrosine-type recombinase/integrase n=1 Tax=Blastomonas sp. TaxID=1909299 RepID=UPI00391BC3DC